MLERRLSGVDVLSGIESVKFSDGTVSLSSLVPITGTAGDDVLAGTAENDTIYGYAGNDMIDGGAGIDRMEGGVGDDTYMVDDAQDVVVERPGEGADTVRSAASYVLAASVENLILTGSAVAGTGNGLDNVITGNALANVLNGGGGSDTLTGGEGDDILIGGAGSDRLEGGTGNDMYFVESQGDTVVEAARGGVDTVTASISYALSENVENLVLGGSAMSGTGNALDNIITGNDQINLLKGGDGDDTLFGGGGSDVLMGDAGNDTLNGGSGLDLLAGGAGDDRYVVDSILDVVTENPGEGIDTVTSTIDWYLGANVENLILSGSQAVIGTGNSGANILTGSDFANILNGGAGNDTLFGGGGNDTLIGGLGNDRLIGGIGGDVFVWSRGSGIDRIADFAAGSTGDDLLQLSIGSAFDSFSEVMAAASQVGADTHLDFGASGKVILENVAMSTLTADDFLFA